MRYVLCVALAIESIGACSPDWSAPSGASLLPVQDVAENWLVELHVSGGFAGLDRMLQLRSTGELTASDRNRRVSVDGQASPEDLDRVAALLENTQAAAVVGDGRCRDCIEYEIRIERDGELRVTRLNDRTRGSSGLEELVRILERLIQDALT